MVIIKKNILFLCTQKNWKRLLNTNIFCNSAVNKMINSVLGHFHYAMVQVRSSMPGDEIQKPFHRAYLAKAKCYCPERYIYLYRSLWYTLFWQ